MSLVVHNELFIDPERLDGFRTFLNVKETLSYPGCISFIVLEDLEKPGRVLFIQEWEGREALERYRAWRTSTGSRAQLRDFYVSPAITSYCRHVGDNA
jgi:quinol monooxygenase YgiN